MSEEKAGRVDDPAIRALFSGHVQCRLPVRLLIDPRDHPRLHHRHRMEDAELYTSTGQLIQEFMGCASPVGTHQDFHPIQLPVLIVEIVRELFDPGGEDLDVVLRAVGASIVRARQRR